MSEGSDETQVNPDEVKEELQIPEHLMGRDPDERAIYDSVSFWGHHPVGSFYRARNTVRSNDNETSSEHLVVLESKTGDKAKVTRFEIRPDQAQEKKMNSQEIDTKAPPAGDQTGQEEKVVVANKYLQSVKTVSVVDFEDGRKTTRTSWYPADANLRNRMLHPVKVHCLTELASGGGTLLEYEERIIVPSDEVVVAEKKVQGFTVKRNVKAPNTGSVVSVRSFAVPGGMVRITEELVSGDVKTVRKEELLDFGVMTPDEIQQWQAKFS